MKTKTVSDIMGVCFLVLCIAANSVLAARIVRWNFEKDKVVNVYGCGLDTSAARKGKLTITETADIDSVVALAVAGWQWAWRNRSGVQITGAEFRFRPSTGDVTTIVHNYTNDFSSLVIAPTYTSSNIAWVEVDIGPSSVDEPNTSSNVKETSLFLYVFRDSVGAGPCVGEIQGTNVKLGSPQSGVPSTDASDHQFNFTLDNIPEGYDNRDMRVTFALGDCANYNSSGGKKYSKVTASANPSASSGDIWPCNVGEGSLLYTLLLADVPANITTVNTTVWASSAIGKYNSIQLCGINIDVEPTSSAPEVSRRLR